MSRTAGLLSEHVILAASLLAASVPHLASAWEAEGASTYKNRRSVYQSAIATRTESSHAGHFHSLTVDLYPWTFTPEQKEGVRGQIKAKDLPAYVEASGMTDADHWITLRFDLKDGQEQFGPENIEKYVLTFSTFDGANRTVSWYTQEAREADKVQLRNFKVDDLGKGGTVSFDFASQHEDVLEAQRNFTVSVRGQATIVRSTIDGKPVYRMPDDPGLAEIEVKPVRGLGVAALVVGAGRLSGKARPRIDAVAEELAGAQFIRLPWKANTTLHLKVTKPGDVYVMRATEEMIADTGLEWEPRPDAVKGPYIWGVYRTYVHQKNKQFRLKGIELSAIGAKILIAK